MSHNKEQIVAVVYASVDELNALMGDKHKLKKSLETILLKDGKGLDSLGFVNLVSLVEEKCQERFGKSLVLTQTDSQVGSRDPFETIETLVDYVEAALRG
jgi:acyl carrier protein